MFRPTPFDTAALTRSIVARRKGGRVRYFDPKTARISGWLPKPKAPALPRTVRAMDSLLAPMMPELEERVAVLGREESLNKLTVPALREMWAEKYGLKPTTRTKKAALVLDLLGA
jgi:hypothetical protein